MAKFQEMNWQAKDLSEEFKLFKQRVILCIQDSNITEPEKQAIKIKIAVGTEGLRRFNASGLSDEDQSNPNKLWSIFENQKVQICDENATGKQILFFDLLIFVYFYEIVKLKENFLIGFPF